MAAAKNYPVSTAQVRPFRIYDEGTEKILKGKCFGYVLNAHNAAQVYAKWWLNVGESVTVLDTKGNDLGQYTRRLNAVQTSPNTPQTLAEVERQQKRGEK